MRYQILRNNVTTNNQAVVHAQFIQDCSRSLEVLNQVSNMEKKLELLVIKRGINFVKSALIQEKEQKIKETDEFLRKHHHEMHKQKKLSSLNRNV